MSEGAPAEPKAQERRERVEYAVRSVASEDHPARNEDAYIAEPDMHLYAVFDGMGGHSAGHEASRAAAADVRDSVSRWEEMTDDDADIMEASLKGVLAGASRAVVERGHELERAASDEDRREWRSPETTAAAVYLHEFTDGRVEAFVANVGDSRVYVQRADGTLEQVSVDHDMLSEADYVHALEDRYQQTIGEGDIVRYRRLLDDADGEAAMPDPLGKALFRMRNRVGRALGSDRPLDARTRRVSVRPGDTIVITSDGVHDNLRHERMREVIAGSVTADECAQRLAAEAYEYAHLAQPKAEKDDRPAQRNKRDDITVVAVRIK